MRPAITPERIATLAESAGFKFTPERCEILAPQLDWLLSQAELLAEMGLENEEPVLVFRPHAAVSLKGADPEYE